MIAGTSAGLGIWWYLTGSVSNVEVPDLEGRNLEEVRTILEERGLQADIVREPSMETPEDRVIRQAPSAGAVIRDNRALQLYVSDGPEYTTVPDLRGMDLVSGRNELVHRLGGDNRAVGTLLNLGNVTRTYSEEVPEGQIIAQNPEPGREVVRGSQVNVLLSRGPWPRTTTVPEVLALPHDEAIQRLEEAGLEVAEPRYNLDPDRDPSVVLEQLPEPGQLIEQGEQVTLTINLDDPDPQEPEYRHTVLRFSPPVEQGDGRLRAVLKDLEGETVVYDRPTPAGTRAEVPVRFLGSAELYLYWNDELYQVRSLEVPRS